MRQRSPSVARAPRSRGVALAALAGLAAAVLVAGASGAAPRPRSITAGAASVVLVPARSVGPGVAAPSDLRPRKGILPPSNPPKNLPPDPNYLASCKSRSLDDSKGCNSVALQAIDNARTTEPLGPLVFDLADLLKLSVPEQQFAVVNLERTSRGLAPVPYLTTQADGLAQVGADDSGDPTVPAGVLTLAGGATIFDWAANWAGGTESALGSDDSWMYDDGPGGPNLACAKAGDQGCWGHRDNILTNFDGELAALECPADRRQVVMGAGNALESYGESFAELFVAACGKAPTGAVYTWAEAAKAIAAGSTTPTSVAIASSPTGKGYLVANSAGAVSRFGDARSAGDLANQSLPAPIVAIAVDDHDGGYWLVSSDGRVYNFGGAPFRGDLKASPPTHPIVAIAVDQATDGYWLVSSNGTVYPFHVTAHGGENGKPLAKPIVAIATDAAAAGYWLVGGDGGLFTFGTAAFEGTEANKHPSSPIVAAAATADGKGYWMAGSNGAVYHFGDAKVEGSELGKHLAHPIVAFAPDPAGTGYWLLGAGGTVYPFGTAPNKGSAK